MTCGDLGSWVRDTLSVFVHVNVYIFNVYIYMLVVYTAGYMSNIHVHTYLFIFFTPPFKPINICTYLYKRAQAA